MTDELQALIERHADIVDFGNGTSEQRLLEAEAVMGFPFPRSYRHWLSQYGGGEICGEEIYGIYNQDFRTVLGGDVVGMYLRDQARAVYPKQVFEVCASDIDGCFFIDCRQVAPGGEAPVRSQALNGAIYAKSFDSFLMKRILIMLD